MPSRFARRQAVHSGLFLLFGLALAVPSRSENLTLPSDPLAGKVIQQTAAPSQGTVTHAGGAVPLGPDGSMIGATPVSAVSAGSYYNPTLGSHIRARYNTQSYAQQEGQLELGTMKLMPLDGGMAFIDGQVTMNDESRVGYNVGVGYRWMTLPLFPFSPDDRKIMGVSFWSDGQSVGGENFFPQVGVSLEFLGDHLDFRANGYAPLGDRTKNRELEATGDQTFSGNSVAQLLRGVQDTALTVGEAELAGRLGDLDAWAFAGVYGFRGGRYETVGGELGLRGYATPDLLLSMSIVSDDEFDTNALFSATWFIGRTRAENCPTGILEDRFREPVLRNSYVANAQDETFVAGDALVAPDGTDIRLVHVDSTAAPGGDGTFESPLNSLDNIAANSMEGDVIYGHSGSDFNSQTAALQDNQFFVGEGGGSVFQITTQSLGVIDLPETAPGAQNGAIPTIAGPAGGAGLTLADNNTVQNLAFDGGQNAIVNRAAGINGATLTNLTVSGTTGNGIDLAAVVATDVDDIDNDGDDTDDINLLGAISISDITFDGVGGHDLQINADTGALANTEIFAETITIDDITSDNNTTAQSIAIRNTTVNGTTSITDLDYNGTGTGTGAGALLIDQTAGDVAINRVTIDGTATEGITITQTENTSNVAIDNVEYEGGSTGMGALLVDRTVGTVTMDQSTLNGGVGPAITVTQAEGNVSVGQAAGQAVEITNVDGEAVFVDRVMDNGTDPSGVAIDANITNDAVDGGGVRVFQNESVVSFGGDIETLNTQSVQVLDARGNVAFSGTIDDNGTGDAITITDNGTNEATNTAEVSLTGNITNDEGRSVVITGGDDDVLFGGDLTDTGDGVVVQNRLADAEVSFNDPNATVTINTAATANNAITLSGNDDTSIFTVLGALDLDTTSGAGIQADGGQIDLNNAANTVNTTTGRAIDIANTSTQSGIQFSELVTNGADRAISADGLEGPGALTIAEGTVTTTGTAVFLEDVGSASITDFTINGSGATAIDINNTGDETSDVTLTNVTTPAGVTRALDAAQTGTGDLSVTVADSTFDDTTGDAVTLTGLDGGADFTNTTIADAGGRGVVISGGSGTFDFDADTTITNPTGDAFVVQGGDGQVNYNGDITNTAGRSVLIQNKDGGGVSFGPTSSVTDTGAGVVAQNNTDGDYNFFGSLDINSGTDNAITVAGNADATDFTFSELVLQTTTGNAFDATGGGDLTVTGSTNTIETTTGRGVNITDMNIVTGVSFDSVTVDGADTAVNLVNNTGGTVTIGSGTGADGSGGTFTTTGAAIVVNNSGGLSANNVTIAGSGATMADIDSTNGTNTTVSFNNVDNTATGGVVNIDHTSTGNLNFTYNNSTTGGAITANHSGAGTFDFNSSDLVVNANIDVNATNGGAFDFFASDLQVTTGADIAALDITLAGSVPNADISITGGNTSLTTGDASAVSIVTGGVDIDFALEDATLTNNSASNTVAFAATGGSLVEAMIADNTFANNGAGDNLRFNNGASATTDLAITNNLGPGGQGLVLQNLSATPNRFQILGADAGGVNTDNNGDITFLDPAGVVDDTAFTFQDDLVVTPPTN